MTNESVDILYNKFEKKVAKKKRADLKKELVSSSNEKFESVNALKMKDLHPLRETKGLIGWIATFLGCLFIVFNLLAYSLAASTFNKYSGIAGKVGTDFKGFSAAANNALTSSVNDTLEAGVRSAYIAEVNDVQSYLDGLAGSLFTDKTDVQNKLEDMTKAYSELNKIYEDFQNDYKVYNDKIDKKLTAEKNLEDAKLKYPIAKAKYDELLEKYKEAIVAFAEEKGAFDGIPEYVYAKEQKPYDDAKKCYDELMAKYSQEELTQLAVDKETYSNAQKTLDDANAELEEREEQLSGTENRLSVAQKQLEDAQGQLTKAKSELDKVKKQLIEDNEGVLSAQADLIRAQEQYNDAIDMGTYDLSTYEQAIADAEAALEAALEVAKEAADNDASVIAAQATVDEAQVNVNAARTAVEDAQAAVDDVQTAVKVAQNVVNEAKRAVDNAKNKITDVLLAEENLALAENNLDDVKSSYQQRLDIINSPESADEEILNEKIEIAEIIFIFTNDDEKASLTEKKKELAEAEEAIMVLPNAENSLKLAEEELSKAEEKFNEAKESLATPARQNDLLVIVDEIVNSVTGNGDFSSSDLFNKISSDYATILQSYITLTESEDDAEVVIDRFLEKNLSAFDTVISSLTDFAGYGYSLDVLEKDIENYSALELSSLDAKIVTAFSDFKDRYSAIGDAQSAYEHVYSDYRLAWDNYNKALKDYNSEQNDANKIVLDREEINLEAVKSSNKFLLIQAVNNVALAKGEANAYLNRLKNYVALYDDIVQNSSSILNDALTYTGELSGNYVDAETPTYITLAGDISLNYIFTDRNTLDSVIARYDLGAYSDNIQAYVDSAKSYTKFVKTSNLNQYSECDDLTDGAISDFDNTVSEVNILFADFTAITAKLDSDGGLLFTDAKNYTSSKDIISTIMMVFNIVLAVTLFGYCLYWILGHRNEAMEENFNLIINALRN